jgi:hypothetical protein
MPLFTDCRQATRCACGSGTRGRLNGRVLYFTLKGISLADGSWTLTGDPGHCARCAVSRSSMVHGRVDCWNARIECRYLATAENRAFCQN